MSQRIGAVCYSIALGLCAACGSSVPSRYVIEHDLGGYAFRRYQKSLDIELPVPDNPATGYTAAYLRRSGTREVAVVSAFVTVYAHAKSLTAEARSQLQSLVGYTLKPGEAAGEHVWWLTGEGEQRFCLWVSANRVVKIGMPATGKPPEDLIASYLDLYPSDLDARGVAKADAPSAGPAKTNESDDDEPDLPANLREGAPR